MTLGCKRPIDPVFHPFFTHRSVTLIAEVAEDMWHAYNLVAVSDRLRATTIR